MTINYVGHAEKWDSIEIDGSVDARDCVVAYKKGGRSLATLTIFRDLQSLQAEAAMEAAIRPQHEMWPDWLARSSKDLGSFKGRQTFQKSSWPP